MPAWLGWLLAAAALAAAETLSLDRVLIMCAGGAGAGAIAAAFGASLNIQLIVAVAATIVLLGVARPVARRHLQGVGTHATGAAALVGREALVLTEVDAHHGLIRLNGQEWTARAYDHTQVLPVGATVRVMEIAGATAVVWEAP